MTALLILIIASPSLACIAVALLRARRARIADDPVEHDTTPRSTWLGG